MTKHIGIVACSAEGAALCYRTICLEGKETMGQHMHPEVSMHNFPLGQYMDIIQAGEGWEGVAELMLSSAEKLALAGAQFLICPDNTIHQAFEWVLDTSPLPWLHIAEEVALAASQTGCKRLGILGTKFLMTGPVYPSKLKAQQIDYLIPEEGERERVHEIIFNELVEGVFAEESRLFFSELIARLKARGCDGIVLGCTEIPLIVRQQDSVLPTFDSTRILARAALKEATSACS